jgi:DNA-binding transcriptional MerR regulator
METVGMKGDLNISEVAAATGLTTHTLRYYERIGLLTPVSRDLAGRRRFAARDLEWIAFLQRLRSMGMSIGEMCRYAALRRDGDSTLRDRRLLLQKHLGRVRQEMAALEESTRVIADKITLYHAMERERSPSSTPEKEARNDNNSHAGTNEKSGHRTLRTRAGKAPRN